MCACVCVCVCVYIYILVSGGISYNLLPLASIVPIKLYRPDIYLIFKDKKKKKKIWGVIVKIYLFVGCQAIVC